MHFRRHSRSARVTGKGSKLTGAKPIQDYRAVELRYHHLLIQQSLLSPGHFTNRLADVDHPLLRGKRTDVSPR